jgi:hypothetical protein
MRKLGGLASLFCLAVLAAGCTSVGHLGIVTKASANNADRLKAGVAFEELGSAEGSACRHFVIAVIPFGDSTFSTAVDDALAQRGGDALVNVTVSSSLYGFVPIYNVYSFTCTSVQGVAVKFKPVNAPTAAEGRPDVIPVVNQGQ